MSPRKREPDVAADNGRFSYDGLDRAFHEKARVSGVQKFPVRDHSRACQGRGQLADVRDSLEYGAHLM